MTEILLAHPIFNLNWSLGKMLFQS